MPAPFFRGRATVVCEAKKEPWAHQKNPYRNPVRSSLKILHELDKIVRSDGRIQMEIMAKADMRDTLLFNRNSRTHALSNGALVSEGSA
jgi:ribosomal protein L36